MTGMSEGISLVCPHCSRAFSPGEAVTCPDHSATGLELSYDLDSVRDQFDLGAATRTDLWRYRPLLPVSDVDAVSLGEGWTDLIAAPDTGDALNVDLALKLEGTNPTGSAKDRGSAVVATSAREYGYDEVVCASTGNAAASIAAYAARGTLDCTLFVPERLSEAKAVQPLVYDASLVTVTGGYGAARKRCQAYVRDRDVVDRSAGANPLTAAGGQTLGFELAEQTHEPAWIAVSMGNGGTLADLWEGFRLFAELGYISTTPRLLGVQAAGCSVLHELIQSGDTVTTEGTSADSIDVDEPHRADDARRAIEESRGTTITVSDDQIRTALRRLGRDEGVFVEPASAAALAGVDAAVEADVIRAGERVIAVMTGNGLKDTETALDAVKEQRCV